MAEVELGGGVGLGGGIAIEGAVSLGMLDGVDGDTLDVPRDSMTGPLFREVVALIDVLVRLLFTALLVGSSECGALVGAGLAFSSSTIATFVLSVGAAAALCAGGGDSVWVTRAGAFSNLPSWDQT